MKKTSFGLRATIPPLSFFLFLSFLASSLVGSCAVQQRARKLAKIETAKAKTETAKKGASELEDGAAEKQANN